MMRRPSRHAKIPLIAQVLALGGGIMCAGVATAAAAAAAAEPSREQKVADLKGYLARKETELSQLTAEHRTRLNDADALAGQVRAQKARGDAGFFEQRALEKNLGRLRVLYEEMEKVSGRVQDVREEAFAAAAAIVAELETSLEQDLVALRDLTDPAARRKAADRLLALERDRRVFQGKMNGFTPDIPVPRDLPAGVAWTPEMVEDQRRSWEATIARLQAEREQVVQERGLRRNLAEALPGAVRSDAAAEARLDARIADLDRKIRLYREKFNRLAARGADGKPLAVRTPAGSTAARE